MEVREGSVIISVDKPLQSKGHQAMLGCIAGMLDKALDDKVIEIALQMGVAKTIALLENPLELLKEMGGIGGKKDAKRGDKPSKKRTPEAGKEPGTDLRARD